MWWRYWWSDLVRGFAGERWTVSEGARDEFGINWIYGHPRAGGLSTEAGTINCGKNSGYQSLGMLYVFGVRRVILVGFDYQATRGKSHWHGDHPRGKLNNGGGTRFPVWRNEMNELARDMKKTGCEVINASRSTALKCFPLMTLEEALCKS